MQISKNWKKTPASELCGKATSMQISPKTGRKKIFVILDGFNLSTCYFYVRDS